MDLGEVIDESYRTLFSLFCVSACLRGFFLGGVDDVVALYVL